MFSKDNTKESSKTKHGVHRHPKGILSLLNHSNLTKTLQNSYKTLQQTSQHSKYQNTQDIHKYTLIQDIYNT